ncbi:MAG: hypothetical protein EBU90_29530 [Proteobacteria bacterium]|nr:hypothetical protein [Pseudomonadota bacterium]
MNKEEIKNINQEIIFNLNNLCMGYWRDMHQAIKIADMALESISEVEINIVKYRIKELKDKYE